MPLFSVHTLARQTEHRAVGCVSEGVGVLHACMCWEGCVVSQVYSVLCSRGMVDACKWEGVSKSCHDVEWSGVGPRIRGEALPSEGLARMYVQPTIPLILSLDPCFWWWWRS